MCGVKGRRFIVLYTQHSICWFTKMYVRSLACQQNVFPRYHSEKKTFLRALPTRWRRKPAGTEITSLSPCVHGSEVVSLSRNLPLKAWLTKTAELLFDTARSLSLTAIHVCATFLNSYASDVNFCRKRALKFHGNASPRKKPLNTGIRWCIPPNFKMWVSRKIAHKQ